MFRRHISSRLAAQIDSELAYHESRRVERHLAQCQLCRTERAEIEFGMAALDQLPVAHAPDSIWSSIEAQLLERQGHSARYSFRWRPAFAALAAIVLATSAYWTLGRRAQAGWEVTRVRGAPLIGSTPLIGATRIRAGEWINTDPSSSAIVKVGEIGSVEVAPNTHLRIVTARPGEHRLGLDHGEIRASISAPPKLFFVDTASGTAVDLGCEYSLHTDEEGTGLLQVTRGWVAFQWNRRESLVPAGASCRIVAHAGPGIPYFEDAPEALKQALKNFAPEDLEIVLGTARVRDTLTLWHLLSRVDGPSRERIFDRMAALTPVPAGVSKEKALQLDPATLTRWKDELAWKW